MGYANFALDIYFRKTDILYKEIVCQYAHTSKLKTIEKSQFYFPYRRIWNGDGGMGKSTVEKQKVLKNNLKLQSK